MVSISPAVMAFDQKDSNYIIIRYLDSGFFLEKDGTATTEWQKLRRKQRQNLIMM